MLKLLVSYIEEHEDEILDELKEYYFEEGVKKGKKKAIKETSLKLAKNFKDIFSDEEISKITGIPFQKVQEL